MDGKPSYTVVPIVGTTDAAGAATAYSKRTGLYGDILSVLVDGVALTNGADLVLTEEMTTVAGAAAVGPEIVNNGDVGNATLLELTPSTVLQEPDGTARVSGTDEIPTLFTLHGGRLKAVIANGGDTKAFKLWVAVRT